jgi:hypothetical protein
MNDNSKSNSLAWIIVIALILWLFNVHGTMRALRDENDNLQDEVYSYSSALDEANSNIEDAQGYAWSTYDEMGDALDNLETVSP